MKTTIIIIGFLALVGFGFYRACDSTIGRTTGIVHTDRALAAALE